MNNKQINLRWLSEIKTVEVPVYPENIGSPKTLVKKEIRRVLQWQTIEQTPMGVIDSDWYDVPIELVDLDMANGRVPL